MGFLAALLYALLMAALPLLEVVYSGRPPGTLLLLYWFETVLLLITGTIRIVVHRRATDKTGHYAPTTLVSKADAGAAEVVRGLGDESTFLHHFVGLTTVFTVAHGLFVLVLVFLFDVGGPIALNDAALALAWATGIHVAWLLYDLPHIAQWTFARLGEFCGNASIRVLVTQLGLIFGIPMVGITGSAWGMIGTFVGLRALADACIAGLQGMMKRRDLPPGLKAFLAKRGKQTTDQIEAEFDALKERGREVEVLLERPITDVRRVPIAAMAWFAATVVGAAVACGDASAANARWKPYGPADAPLAAIWSDPRTGATTALTVEGIVPQYLRSVDGGRTWRAVHDFSTSASPGRLAFAATPGTELVPGGSGQAGDTSTMLVTIDEGRSFAPLRFPTPPPLPLRDLQAFNPDAPDEQVYQALGTDAIVVTRNGGRSWRVIPIGFQSYQGPANTMVDWMHRRVYTGAGEFMFEQQSLDAPASWQWIANDSGVAGVRGGTFLQMRNTGIHRSVDGGQSYAPVHPWDYSAPFFVQFAFATAPHSRVYGLAFNDEPNVATVFRSDDDGQSWRAAGTYACECIFDRLHVDVLDPDRLMLVTSQGMVESTDGGLTFAPMRPASGLPGRYAEGLAFESGAAGRRWTLSEPQAVSADQGAHWSHVATGTGIVGEPIRLIDGIAVPGVLFGIGYSGGSRQRFYRSVDGGASWSFQFEQDNYNRYALARIVVDAAAGALHLIGTSWGYFGHTSAYAHKSNDGGATWTMRGIGGTVNDVAASAQPPFRLFVATRTALRTSLDGGATWSPVSGAPAGDVASIAVDPRNAAHLLAGYSGADRVPLLRSIDGGITWMPSAAGLGGGAVTSIVFDARDADVAYAAQTGQGVFRSIDGGRTWRAMDEGLGSRQVVRLQLDPAGGRVLYASTERGVFTWSLDEGVPAGSTRAVEFFHAAMNHYFVTSDLDEVDALDRAAFEGWQRTGEAMNVFDSAGGDTLPVCRYFATGFAPQSTHFYSPYPHECGLLYTAPGWTFERFAFRWSLPREDGGCPPETRPIHRLFNALAGSAPNHRYTASMATLGAMLQDGWIFEGDARTRVFACVPR